MSDYIELSANEILSCIGDNYKDISLNIYDTINSTNTTLKELAAKGIDNYSTILAEYQTNGRGRLGRSFYSPKGSGLYLSTCISTDRLNKDIQLVTIITAVALCRALKKVANISPGIKWVNDIFLNGKKLCGILAEAVTDPDTCSIKSIIIGIGVNCTTKSEDFPKELSSIATSISDISINRNELAAAILTELFNAINYDNTSDLLNEYSNLLFIKNKEVNFVMDGISYVGTVKDIDDKGHLIVKCNDNTIRHLHSGDVSIRGINYEKDNQ